MSYRPLTIMAPLYRRWASMRLKCLDGWVSTWALPQMFVGVAQQGAADATYQVLSEVEKMTLEGVPYYGGAADIYKFFDQILRRLAGMPTCILEAYKRFLEDLVTYNTILWPGGWVMARSGYVACRKDAHSP